MAAIFPPRSSPLQQLGGLGRSHPGLHIVERVHCSSPAVKQQPHEAAPPGTCLAAKGGFGGVDKATASLCPCGSQQPFKECCQPYLKSQVVIAPSPEAVLRARFSAFSKKDVKYIKNTTHPLNPARQGSTSEDGKVKTSFERDIQVSMSWAEYLSLSLKQIRQGASGEEAWIEFEFQVKRRYELATGEKVAKPVVETIRCVLLLQTVLMLRACWKALSTCLPAHTQGDRAFPEGGRRLAAAGLQFKLGPEQAGGVCILI